MHIGETRGEILRLVARLRASQQAATARRPEARPGRTVTEPDPSLREMAPSARATRRSDPVPAPPRDRPHVAHERVRQRQRELDEIREMRAQLAERTGERSALRATLARIEERVIGLEEAVTGLMRDSRSPSGRDGSRRSRDWSSNPPSRSSRHAPAALAALNEDVSGCMFSGVIEGQLLSDMLQLVSSNSLSGLFVVTTPDGRTELFFEEGKIFHATGPNLVGELAFFAAFGADRGHYSFRELEELPDERTINSSTQLLILEALRQIDETSNEETDTDTDIEI